MSDARSTSYPCAWDAWPPPRSHFYAWACGVLLARAHARAGDAAAIAGYCGGSAVLDQALATWEEAYGDQTDGDHEHLVKAIKSGKVKAIMGV